jgi:uncharacterized protein with ParB-like and HNH nuclease domain
LVLFAQRKYRIPRYQRPYAWDQEEVSEFWEDLSTNEEPYFLGSFIFNTETEEKDGFVDIIEGQQRLLTITILCAVLRDLAKDLDPAKANRYHRQDITFESRGGEQSARIQPGDSLAGFFKKHVHDYNGDILKAAESTPEESRVKQVYVYLREKAAEEIARFESREKKLEFLELIRTRTSKLIVINVEITQEEDAYEIFETTNARGLELSIADLLKNLIFKKLKPTDDKDFAKESWQEITGNIDPTQLRKFIRYFWISKYAFISEKKLYREIKKQIADWQEMLLDLLTNSACYNKLVEGEESDFQEFGKHGYKIYDSVFALRLMGISQCYVFLLSVLRNYERLGTDPTRVFQLIEKFSFQYFAICKQSPNKVEKIYSKCAIELETICEETKKDKIAGEVQALFARLEKSLKVLAPSENTFKEKFDSLSYKNSDDGRRLVKYVLSKTDRHLSKTDEHKLDFNRVNIEHILSQKPSKELKLTKKEIKPYVNKIGNLTLLSKVINSRVKNGPVSQKISEYETSKIAITEKLVQHLKELQFKWGENEINQRQNDLAILAFKHVWSI